ncbi:ATP-binding protein [Mycoplasma bradburyae]|uniref:ATP-binding protein n=1 Tax=Mycoplasma bradburyae TaxID=2963128 RepID=A0ABT5GD25_9MOLU|nr:ATP-binding protein [Mycoplasma bradburyae]MDC4182286.1 ATP-binding protein [Mycoplasma bradburyae]UTS69792.1 ATP-binding protein [Mycoplasma bradburyae]
MKKGYVINLIKYYAEHNHPGFRAQAYQIANEFEKIGDLELSSYIVSLLAGDFSFFPQIVESDLQFIKKIDLWKNSLPLPTEIESDIIGIINATNRKIGVNKFLFQGAPGTGKTETVKQMAVILKKTLYTVDFANLVDSKLGETVKNINRLFDEINRGIDPSNSIILFDEIDAIAMDRTNSKDLREMGRATTAILKGLDGLNEKIIIVATTNLYEHFDKALTRRFDSVINFNRYSKQDLMEIAEIILNNYLSKFDNVTKNIRLFKKIIELQEKIPYPGDLKNLIRTSLAFSDPNSEYDYLKRLYESITNDRTKDLSNLKKKGFTVREIEILTGISKSQVSRELNRK